VSRFRCRAFGSHCRPPHEGTKTRPQAKTGQTAIVGILSAEACRACWAIERTPRGVEEVPAPEAETALMLEQVEREESEANNV
jgi:hypothetical protein